MKPETPAQGIPCSECGISISPATAQETGGKCRACSGRQQEAELQARREKGDHLVEHFAWHYIGAPAARAAKARATADFQALVCFLEKNGLTRRTILKPGQEPNCSTQIWASDLTEEGNKLMEAAGDKWTRACTRGAPPEDTTILANALAQIRNPGGTAGGGVASAARTPAAPRKRPRSAAKRPGRPGKARAKGKGSAGEDSGNPPGWTEELEREFEEAGPHVYDKAKWHYEGDYPKDLPQEQAFVHTGMFAGWLMDHDMISEDFLPEVERFKRKEITGPQAYEIWDGGLDSDMLTSEGNQFAREYYGEAFAKDYQKLLARGLPSFYHVQDTWENYAILKRQIDARYAAWKKSSERGKGRSRSRH